jgi:hypothetical protein
VKMVKNVEYCAMKASYAEYQFAYCCKCLSDGIDPVKAYVIYRDSTQETTSITAHINKNHTGEEAPILLRYTVLQSAVCFAGCQSMCQITVQSS